LKGRTKSEWIRDRYLLEIITAKNLGINMRMEKTFILFTLVCHPRTNWI